MIKVDDVQQGTLTWLECRLGIPTASQFSKIVTPSGKLSSARDGYMAQLLAEWALGAQVDDFLGTEWTERGKVLEPEARAYYSFQRDVEARTVGFVYKDEGKFVGCSPDGLVGQDGCLELKCPKAGTHLMWLAGGGLPQKTSMPSPRGDLGDGICLVRLHVLLPSPPPAAGPGRSRPDVSGGSRPAHPSFYRGGEGWSRALA